MNRQLANQKKANVNLDNCEIRNECKENSW